MNRKIYKYMLNEYSEQKVFLPLASVVISIEKQNDAAVLYAIVDTDCKENGYINVSRRLTGESLNEIGIIEVARTLLFSNDKFVVHYFANHYPKKLPEIPEIKIKGRWHAGNDDLLKALGID